MKKEKLYEILELDTAADFSYFEQMAELLESDEAFDEKDFAEALSMIDQDTASSLIENYFEELSNASPDDSDDFVSLIETIKQNLLFAANNIENERKAFVDALFYFRSWYKKEGGALVDGKAASIFDAVTEYRAEKIGQAKHKYEFISCDEYELDNLSMGLGSYSKIDILAEDRDEYDEEES